MKVPWEPPPAGNATAARDPGPGHPVAANGAAGPPPHRQPAGSGTVATAELVRPISILLVEDSPGDAKLTSIALERGKLRNVLQLARDGQEAITLLRQAAAGDASALPDVVLLDLDLPVKDGRQVLTEMKADPALSHVPVIVLTSSTSDSDILRSYNLNAAAYIVKPVDFAKFIDVIQSLDGFYLQVVRVAQP